MAKQTPEQMAQTMIENMPDKTGKSLDEWLALVRDAGGTDLGKHGAIVKHLKSEHGLTHGYANLVAHRFLDSGDKAPEDLVDAQYGGPKAALRPIYEAICRTVAAFGDDVDISPKKTYVSLRRSRQFALVQPSTRSRVDLGVNLKGKAPGARLEASGSFNAMVSHRVRLSDVGDVDKELKGWLRDAYEQA